MDFGIFQRLVFLSQKVDFIFSFNGKEFGKEFLNFFFPEEFKGTVFLPRKEGYVGFNDRFLIGPFSLSQFLGCLNNLQVSIEGI